MAQFDTTIVGTGSAVGMTANRFSVDPTPPLLSLEAGPEERGRWIHVPDVARLLVGRNA